MSSSIHHKGDFLLGRYVVHELLSRGMNEERYLAEHRELGHLVDVRCFIGPSDSSHLARFERSARMIARVRDPRVVSLMDYGVEATTPMLVLEHIEGQTIRTLLDDSGPLEWSQALEIGESILGAVGNLHAVSVLHRHLRPASIYLADTGRGPPQVKLSDLGLAKPASDDTARITAVGSVLGTPVYMSPEQLDMDIIDQRSDLYAAALVVFEMLTGNIPEGGRTRLALARRLVSDPAPPRAPEGLPAIPEAVQEVVVRGLARDPERRFQSAQSFAEALSAVRHSAGPGRTVAEAAVPRWRLVEAPPLRTRVLRLRPTTGERRQRELNKSARASTYHPDLSGYPVRALVACRVHHTADSTLRGHIELLLEQFGDSYRVSDTAWIGAVRAKSRVTVKDKLTRLERALQTTLGGRGAVVVECSDDVIDVPDATLAGLAPPTVEMMQLLERASAQLRRG